MKLDNIRKLFIHNFIKIQDGLLIKSKDSLCYFSVKYIDYDNSVVCLYCVLSNTDLISCRSEYFITANNNFLILKSKSDLFVTEYEIDQVFLFDENENLPLFRVRNNPNHFVIELIDGFSFDYNFKENLFNFMKQNGGIYNSSLEYFVFTNPKSNIYQYIEERPVT